ncbi:CU044_5270 family protein [Streptomyces macrosporus]|uniref:CU044_5270 family protein n=1 Tax=Streptomyces macrosporus TaxID=44032 RepID=A0ABN3JVD1_9ACTN
MKHDVMRRLAAARPGHLDPDRPVDPEVRARELDRAMLSARAEEGAERAPAAKPARRPLWRPRPVWGAALTATAAAVAAAVIVSGTPGVEGVRPGGTDVARRTLGPSQVLLAAASDVERTPDASGAYWYQEERHGSLREVPGEGYTLDVRRLSRRWIAAGTDEQWSQDIDLGARPASPADEEAWRADGSPKEWDLTPPDAPDGAEREIVTHKGEGLIDADAPGGIADSGRMGDFDTAELPTLSTEPEKLRTQLTALVDRHYNGPPRIMAELLLRTTVHLAFDMPATPRQRAAAYRLLATLPGVRDLGETETRDGRTGKAVAIESRTGDDEERLFFDPATGAPMAREYVAVTAHDGREPGEVLGYTLITEMTWTDRKPPFDEDRRPGPAGPEAERVEKPEPEPADER